MGDFIFFLIIIVAILVIYSIWSSTHTKRVDSTSSATSSASKAQLAEDIKATQTSRIADAVEILDEMRGLSSNHRQYCELVGTSQKEGGVIAPYSQRQVAYYDVRCYKIEYKGGQEVETLIAQESSFDPFYFKDDSSDTPVYVDLSSFGPNTILVNSTNHIEGPESEFAKAVNKKVAAATKGNASLAIVGTLREKLGNLLGNFSDVLDHALLPGGAPQLAHAALAGGSAGTIGTNLLFANKMASHGKQVASRGGVGGRPSQRPQNSSRNVTINLGGLGTFLGGGYGYGQSFGGFPYGGGYYRRGYDLGSAMLDIGLGALLGSLSSVSRPTTTTQTTTPQSTFRGYRLVENVVPLGSPIYCIGELYRHGTDVYMGASTSQEYSTSFFATKPEAEVLSQLGA